MPSYQSVSLTFLTVTPERGVPPLLTWIPNEFDASTPSMVCPLPSKITLEHFIEIAGLWLVAMSCARTYVPGDEMTVGPVTWTVAADTNGVAIRAMRTRRPILKKGLHSIRFKLEFHPIKLLCYFRR